MIRWFVGAKMPLWLFLLLWTIMGVNLFSKEHYLQKAYKREDRLAEQFNEAIEYVKRSNEQFSKCSSNFDQMRDIAVRAIKECNR